MSCPVSCGLPTGAEGKPDYDSETATPRRNVYGLSNWPWPTDPAKAKALQNEISELRAKMAQARIDLELEERNIAPAGNYGPGYWRGYGPGMRGYGRHMMGAYGPGMWGYGRPMMGGYGPGMWGYGSPMMGGYGPGMMGPGGYRMGGYGPGACWN